MNMRFMYQRNVGLDLLRVFCIYLVVFVQHIFASLYPGGDWGCIDTHGEKPFLWLYFAGVTNQFTVPMCSHFYPH